MKVYIGNDHGGYELKKVLEKRLQELGLECVNVGTDSYMAKMTRRQCF